MKIQLFSLVAIVGLTIAPGTFAQTSGNTNTTTIDQGQVNTVTGSENTTQGGTQTATNTTTQNGSVTNNSIIVINQSQINAANSSQNFNQGGRQINTVAIGPDAANISTTGIAITNSFVLTKVQQLQQNPPMANQTTTQINGLRLSINLPNKFVYVGGVK